LRQRVARAIFDSSCQGQQSVLFQGAQRQHVRSRLVAGDQQQVADTDQLVVAESALGIALSGDQAAEQVVARL